MFLEVKPRPPIINAFFTQSGKLGDTSAGFTQSLFFGDNFIDLTGVFLVNADSRIPFTVNRQYVLVTSGNSYENITGNWSGYFYSGTTGDYRVDNSLTPNSFYPTGLVSGNFTHASSNFDVRYVELTGVPSGSPFTFIGSGWVASGSMDQSIATIRNEEINLLNLKSRNFFKFCDDTLSGSGILTTGINDPLAFSSGIQKLIVDANTYYLNCSTGAFKVELFRLRPASTGISGSSCCGTHTYDIYPSGGDTGNFVFIKYDGVNQTFTGYSGEATGYDSGLLFPNLLSEFISDLSGRIDFYYTGGHISCPPSRISGLSIGATGIFAQIDIRDGDFFGGNTLVCFPTGEVGISGYNIFTEVHCSGGCIETEQFSQDNCVLYNKNTLSFIIPQRIKPGNYDLRVENKFGKTIANEVIKLLAPPKGVRVRGAKLCDFGQLPNSFLLGSWVEDYALTDKAGVKYFSSPVGNIYLDNFDIATGNYTVMNQSSPSVGDEAPAIGFGELACGRSYHGRAWSGVLGVHFRESNAREAEEYEQSASCVGPDVGGASIVPMLLLHPNVYFRDSNSVLKRGDEYPTQFVNDGVICPSKYFIHTPPHNHFPKPSTPHFFHADICNIPITGGYIVKERVYDCRNLIEETIILAKEGPVTYINGLPHLELGYDSFDGSSYIGYQTIAEAQAATPIGYISRQMETSSFSYLQNINVQSLWLPYYKLRDGNVVGLSHREQASAYEGFIFYIHRPGRGWDTIAGAAAGATGINYHTTRFMPVSGDSLRCNLDITGENPYASNVMMKSAFVYADDFKTRNGDYNLNGHMPYREGQYMPRFELVPTLVEFYPIKDSNRIIGISHLPAFFGADDGLQIEGNDYLSFHTGC